MVSRPLCQCQHEDKDSPARLVRFRLTRHPSASILFEQHDKPILIQTPTVEIDPLRESNLVLME